MIEFTGIAKRYGDWMAVEDLDLTIAKGEFCVLIGASGSGKSTILKMINRLVEHDAGEIRFAGQEIRSFPPEAIRRRMGYAIQSVGLFPHWTVADNIATVPRLLGWDERRIAARVDELLALLDLDASRLRAAWPHQLSGGQQQRVGVARALAADPDVLLMDEPFGALDPITRASLQQEIARIHAARARTIVFVTHDIDEALRLATRIVVIDKGRIVQAASPRDLVNAPANAFVRDFLGQEDYGLKLLAVEPVSAHMRPADGSMQGTETGEGTQTGEGTETGSCIGPDDTLRAALSRLVAARADRIAVIAEGRRVGTLHLSDIVR